MPPKEKHKKPINKGAPKILRNDKKKNNDKLNIPEIQVTIPQNQQNILNSFGGQLQNENLMPGKNAIKINLANKENNLQAKWGRKAVAKNKSIIINTGQQLELTKEIVPVEKSKETKNTVRLRGNKFQNTEPGEKQSEIKNQLTSPNAVIKRQPGPRSGPRTRKKINDEAKKMKSKEIESSNSKNKIIDLLHPRRLPLAGLELSWTKDMSSSSTSTCVSISSNDFIRIDNKIPFIKLTNIVKQLRNDEHTNDNDKEEHNNIDTQLQCVKLPNIQLDSSSSSSSSSSDQKTCHNVHITPALVELSSKLKNFDLEIMNRIGGNFSENNLSNDISNIKDKIIDSNFLQEERDVILHCQSIKRILSEYTFIEENKKEICDNHIEVNVESNELSVMNISDNTKTTTVEKSEQSISNVEIKPNQLEGKANNITFNDEDDALSLYAESISDVESPKNCNQKSQEKIKEYIPLPTKDNIFKRPEKVIYKPTKIKKFMAEEAKNAMEVEVCEKSNADSTSMYKDSDASDENIVIYEDTLGEVERTLENPVQNESILMGVNQKPKQGIHSVLFRGICIFNLTISCRNKNCKFPHEILDNNCIRLKLRNLDNLLFKEEYIFVRAWALLRRLYGICFVEDCIRRRLTRVLIEITLDLVNMSFNKEDGILGVQAVETTLVYLNDTELHVYGDLLKHKVKNNRLLCDVFLDIIAKSQNFSRFKIIFINLTDFMCDVGLTFECDMASHVLERVCILPFDFNLTKALIKVIRNTDFIIFSNPMMKMFEQCLLNSTTELYKEFCALKDENSKSVCDGNCYNSPLDNDLERFNNPGYSEDDIRYSPDTTNLDNFTNTPIEPKFKRTVDLKKLKVFNDLANSSSSESGDIYTHRHHRTWKNNNRPSLNRNFVRGWHCNMRPPLQDAFKRRSDQCFDPSPSKLPRRSSYQGPTYF